MPPWLESIGVILLAALGIVAGHYFGRQRTRWWLLGYWLPLALIFAIGAARWWVTVAFTPPFVWFAAGRIKFAVLGFAVPMMLTTLRPRLRRKALRPLLVALMTLVIGVYAVPPFAVPALCRDFHENLKTVIDRNGVCWQTTDYTCGPAAAVTALKRLGLQAKEGELAILAYTTPTTGTPADLLCLALQEKYGQQGLRCEYRAFDSIAALRAAGLVIVEVKWTFLIDHWITVLEVTAENVIVGDPVNGKVELTHNQFARIWRYTGIVVRREREANEEN